MDLADAETRILQEHQVSTMDADALAPWVWRDFNH